LGPCVWFNIVNSMGAYYNGPIFYVGAYYSGPINYVGAYFCCKCLIIVVRDGGEGGPVGAMGTPPPQKEKKKK
jgi:hypothetical protein